MLTLGKFVIKNQFISLSNFHTKSKDLLCWVMNKSSLPLKYFVMELCRLSNIKKNFKFFIYSNLQGPILNFSLWISVCVWICHWNNQILLNPNYSWFQIEKSTKACRLNTSMYSLKILIEICWRYHPKFPIISFSNCCFNQAIWSQNLIINILYKFSPWSSVLRI